MTDTTDQSRRAQKAPLPPEVLADALHDRTHENSGRLLHASPIVAAAGTGDHCKHGTPRDPNWVCMQCGNEALRQSADADYNAIGTTVTQTESASEYAELLADLAISESYGNHTARLAIAAIRALEAKAAASEAALQELLARIHRDGGHYAAQHGLAKAAEDADQIVAELFADRDHWKRSFDRMAGDAFAEKRRNESLSADRDRLAGEVERLTNELGADRARIERLAELNDQQTDANVRAVARLTSELAAARENEARYAWLKDNAYEWPNGPCCALDQQERAALWLLRMEDDIDDSIDAARHAGEGEK